MKKLGLYVQVLLISLFFLACDDNNRDVASPQPANTWLPLKIDGTKLEAQVVISSGEQRKGLMYRETLGDNRGMLFPYAQPQQMSFWMANTYIPLDIGFFDGDGVLKEVYRMYPNDTTTTQSRSTELQFALEMNAGWFSENNLTSGAQLDMDLLAKALKARGADPAKFGLTR